MSRIREYYLEDKEEFPTESISNTPPKLYKQEMDWTCSIACIRTLLSGVQEEMGEEEEIIKKYKFEVGPHYSKDIKSKNIFPSTLNVIYGCDVKSITLKQLFNLMSEGYYIMSESMYNYAHWYVLLGYHVVGDNPEKHKIMIYDPYYDEVKLLNADEFSGMWVDGDHEKTGVYRDFIAVKREN